MKQEIKNNKCIYIMQMHTNTIPANIVKICTRYKYSHVSLSFNKDCYKTYSFGRRKINNPLNGVFVIEKKMKNFSGNLIKQFVEYMKLK